MSASGQTQHLHLSQYVRADRPSYVDDYNDDMRRIDSGFNLAQGNALTALQRCADNSTNIQGLSSRVDTLEQSGSGAGAGAGALVYELREGDNTSGSVSQSALGEMVLLTFPSSVSSHGNISWSIGSDAMLTLGAGDYIIQASVTMQHSGHTPDDCVLVLVERDQPKVAAPSAYMGMMASRATYIATLCSTVHVNTTSQFAVAYSFSMSNVSAGATYTILNPSLSIISLSQRLTKGPHHV